jgi:hypothetical protein
VLGGSEDLISKTESFHLRSCQKSCGRHNRGIGIRHRNRCGVFATSSNWLIIKDAPRQCCTRVVTVHLPSNMSAVCRGIDASPTNPGYACIQWVAFAVFDGTACCISVIYS